MSKSGNFNDLKKIVSGYRIKVHCLNCNAEYVSNLLPELKLPRKCKFCHSTKIEPIRYWEG